MSTARPVTRKVTPSNKAKRDEALDMGLKLTIDGEEFEARVGDVTPAIARELRARTGMGFMKLLDTVAADPDVDVISAFVWVARRVRGEMVALDDVEVSYADILADGFTADVAGAEKVDDSPEA